MKESLRLNKNIIENEIQPGQQLALFLIYTPKEELSFDLINRKMNKLLNKITNQL